MMAAALAEGTTFIENAAKEPEIVNLAEILRLMGAPVKGDGTETIRVTGMDSLHSASGEIIPDRIEAATYLMAGVITNGSVTVKGISANYMEAILNKLQEAGVEIDVFGSEITAKWVAPLKGVTIKTMPYPGFPTDTQPQLMAVLTLAGGTSVVHESVFDHACSTSTNLRRWGLKSKFRTTSRSSPASANSTVRRSILQISVLERR